MNVLRHWRCRERWIEGEGEIRVKGKALTDYVGELATTGQRAAALLLMAWLENRNGLCVLFDVKPAVGATGSAAAGA